MGHLLHPRTLWTLAFVLAQTTAAVVTAIPAIRGDLGGPTWHHNASLAVTLALFLSTGLIKTSNGRLWSNRAHLGIGILVWTVLATASGFVLLYLKQELKVWDLKDWAKWWHIAWSWLALWYFVAHSAVNWSAYVRALRSMQAAWAFWVTLAMILVAIPLTWSNWGAQNIVEQNFIILTLWTWIAVTAPTYATWWMVRRRTISGRAVASQVRTSAVRFTDTWLLPMAILANVSGFPLLYFNTKATSLKYVAKYWHVWPSIAFALLVFAHAIQWWLAMRAHWRTAQDAVS